MKRVLQLSPRRCWKVFSWLVLATALCSIEPVLSQEGPRLELKSSADKMDVTVGERLTFIIEAVYEAGIVVQMPGEEIPLGPFELQRFHLEGPESKPPSSYVLRGVYEITAFETGDLEIPAIKIGYLVNSEADTNFQNTQPLKIHVGSLLTEETQDIELIKPPLEIPRDWWRLLLITVLLLLMAAAGAWVYFRWKRRSPSSGGEVSPNIPQLPPHQVALAALEALRNSRLWEKGEIPRFHVEVSEIIRTYVEGRYQVEALERTTSETLSELSMAGLAEKHLSDLHDFLSRCDLVKFAKHIPNLHQCVAILDLAFQIINETKPAIAPLDLTSASERGFDDLEARGPAEQGPERLIQGRAD